MRTFDLKTKEYKNFNEFIKIADNLSQTHKSIEEIRKKFDKKFLHRYINAGKLCESAKSLLESKTKEVKLSLDSLVKNRLHHRDIGFDEYKLIPDILKNPYKIAKSKNMEDIILFKNNNKKYMLVVKTTKNKFENYVKSFRRLADKEFNKY